MSSGIRRIISTGRSATIGTRRLSFLCFLAAATLHAATEPFFITHFLRDPYPGEIVDGTGSIGKEGLRLDAGAHYRLNLPEAHTVRNGVLELSFYPPRLDIRALPLIPPEQECYCAIKVHLERLVLDLSDRWIRLYELDSTRLDIARSLYDQSIRMIPDGKLTALSLRIVDRIIHVRMDDQLLFSAPVSNYDFDETSIVSFGYPFHLSQLSLTEINKDTLRITKSGSIEFAAEFLPHQFNSGEPRHHHLIVWKNGQAGPHAPFACWASDSALFEALVRIGAQPSNNLSVRSWTQRSDPNAVEPSKRITGSRLGISVLFGNDTLSMEKVVDDLSGTPFLWRFGGNRSTAPTWNTGSVVCLQSCPGGLIGHASYSMHDLTSGKTRFALRESLPFRAGDIVTIRISGAGR